ncbi:SufD family Fe-S cluster assembly protein [Candidatus Woesearchaeota archaeon]|nr:SufD family Fe-S cluster assembly protein [Candidatus Woesearchaeota archaeon]
MISKLKDNIELLKKDSKEIQSKIGIGSTLKLPNLSNLDFEGNSIIKISEGKKTQKNLDKIDSKFLDNTWNDEISNSYIEGLSFGNLNYFELEGNDNLKLDLFSEDSLKANSEIIIINCKNNYSGEIIIKKSGVSKYFQDTLRVLVNEGANVKLIFVDDVNSNSNSFSYNTFKVNKNSILDIKRVFMGSGFNYSKIKCFQNSSNVKISSLILSKEVSQKFLDIKINQENKNNNSDVKIKGICDDSAKIISRSNINISKDAKEGSAYESIDFLNLSENCESDMMPFLEINNPNISCSHRATIELVDEDKLFYLQSRGLSKEDSKNLIVDSFIRNEINSLPESIREDVLGKISLNFMEGKHEI